ncbi:MAG: hypothetical protein WBX95_22810, partial [Xanthobacteraceae bacterium]
LRGRRAHLAASRALTPHIKHVARGSLRAVASGLATQQTSYLVRPDSQRSQRDAAVNAELR